MDREALQQRIAGLEKAAQERVDVMQKSDGALQVLLNRLDVYREWLKDIKENGQCSELISASETSSAPSSPLEA